MSARGHVEGRRPTTPDAKITDHEIKAEDARHLTRGAQACRAHLQDLIRAHGTQKITRRIGP
jgi:hypothetical protein